MSKGKVLM